MWFENSGDVFEGNLVMRPYLPIGMPERWGERVDGNLLAVASGPERPAAELARLSGQDESSHRAPPSRSMKICSPWTGAFRKTTRMA